VVEIIRLSPGASKKFPHINGALSHAEIQPALASGRIDFCDYREIWHRLQRSLRVQRNELSRGPCTWPRSALARRIKLLPTLLPTRQQLTSGDGYRIAADVMATGRRQWRVRSCLRIRCSRARCVPERRSHRGHSGSLTGNASAQPQVSQSAGDSDTAPKTDLSRDGL
jgi:hypothetical protein